MKSSHENKQKASNSNITEYSKNSSATTKNTLRKSNKEELKVPIKRRK